jgi:hypothetical protein
MSIKYLNYAYLMPTNPIETLVLITLANYADEDGFCFPGYESLINKTKLSKSALAKTLAILGGAGFFEKKEHSSIGYGRKVNTYRMSFDATWFEEVHINPAVGMRLQLIESTRLLLIEKINKLRKSKQRPISSSLVPRKVVSSYSSGSSIVHESSFNHHKEPSLLKKEGFAIPTIQELAEYISEKNYSVDPESFHAHYSSNGWVVGKTKMKCWKSALVTWEKRSGQFKPSYGKGKQPTQRPDYGDYEPSDSKFNDIKSIEGERVI